jgi:hypothetical protein
MANVLHFMPDEADKPACGAKVFLCNEYTDNRRYVDCGRCKRTKLFGNYDPARFDVDVWNHEGDVIRWFRSVTADEVESIRKDYEDNPTAQVVVTDAAPAGH